MNRSGKLLTVLPVVFLLTTHPLPAPIFEKKPTTPKPAAPKAKPAKKPTVTRKPPPATPAPRFAGTWTGVVDIPGPVMGGAQPCTYVVNSAETSITSSGRGWGGTRPARVNGNTLTYVAGAMGEITTKITLIDSRTARVVVTSNLWGSGKPSEVKRDR